MDRRSFVRTSGLGLAGLSLAGLSSCSRSNDLIVGHGTHRYKVDLDWGARHTNGFPVKDCHEMVQDRRGRIYLLTNHVKNNVLVYDTSGKLLDSWGTTFPGAHGLTLHDEGGEEFLYITDTDTHTVTKTTLDGRVVMHLPSPLSTGLYGNADNTANLSNFKPTETCIADNGDIYVADGYGMQHILRYSAKGEFLQAFGGRGDEEHHLDNAHGICIDRRGGGQGHLLVTDRMKNKLKKFSLDGAFLGSIHLPGAYICRPVIHGEHLYLATIWSGDGAQGSGLVTILDQENRIVSAPGGGLPKGEEPTRQALRLFTHPHDVCVDRDENLYIPQWNAGGTHPIKLMRV